MKEKLMTDFLELIEVKTEEGINKLNNLCIGTVEYEMMVQHIVNNIKLLKEQPQQRNHQPIADHIGKEFE